VVVDLLVDAATVVHLDWLALHLIKEHRVNMNT
jgi:hypothetical protein